MRAVPLALAGSGQYKGTGANPPLQKPATIPENYQLIKSSARHTAVNKEGKPTTDEATRKTTTRNNTHTHTHAPPEHTGVNVIVKNCKPFEISNARKLSVKIKVHRHYIVSLMMAI